jgi:hypothetical protein
VNCFAFLGALGVLGNEKRFCMDQRDKLDHISRQIIGAAIEVHKVLGPGLLESAYQACLAFELRERGMKIEEQTPLPITYKSVKLDCG